MLSTRCSNLPFESKFKICALKLHAKKSYRQLEKLVDIPKSTIQYNFSSMLKEVKDEESFHWDETKHLVFFLLNGIFEGQMPVRGAAAMIRNYFGQEVSHQTLLVILKEAAKIAAKENRNLCLKNINSPIFDEVFQGSTPILSMADPVSGLIRLKSSPNRTKDAWISFLEELKDCGLKPESVNTDGAQSLLSALSVVFKDASQMRDLFHVLQKLNKARRAMEGICYGLIKTEENQVSTHPIRSTCSQAIALFDLFEKGLKTLQRACYLTHDQGQGHYTSAMELEDCLMECQELLDMFINKIGHKPPIYDALTYLNEGTEAMIAYKKHIEAKVLEVFGEIHTPTVLSGIMPILECLMQYQRSYESRSRMEYWGQKVAQMRAYLRSLTFVQQEEVDAAIEKAWRIINSAVKSNSFIEAVNAVLRGHLNTFKCIPTWFCELFTFFWNHRVFKRGKRANSSPIQLYGLKQDHSQSWMAKIMAKFPFEKIRSKLSPKVPVLIH